MLLSLLFSWAIGIFASIGGTIYYKTNNYLGCESELTGVLEMWKNVDDYLIYVDSLFCSPMCPCTIIEDLRTKYKEHYLFYEYSNTLVDDGTKNTPFTFNFKNCSWAVRNEAFKRYMETQGATNHYIEPNKFADYWSGLEQRFNCTGWCKTTYINPYTYSKGVMIKYVFSDINRGIPEYPGCLNQIINWLPSLMGAIGGCLIISALLQTISWFCALSLTTKPTEHHKVNPETL